LGEPEVGRVGEFGRIERVVELGLGDVVAMGGGEGQGAGAAGVAFLIYADVSDVVLSSDFETYLYSSPLSACASE